MNKLLLTCLLGIFITGCGPKELSPEDKALVVSLKSELQSTNQDIASATTEREKYESGLIPQLITARTELLKINKELIEQRINALESGSPIVVQTEVSVPDHELAKSIMAEMESLKLEIAKDKADSAQYSGGLVLVLKLSTIATKEQSLAALQQQYLIAKYGLKSLTLTKPPSSNLNAPAVDSSTEPKEVVAEKVTKLPASNGPFGLEAGLNQKNIEDMAGGKLTPIPDSTYLYSISKLPKNNPEFEAYALVISPTVGLCQIRAVGKDIQSDSHGIQMRAKFEELKSTLTNVYGNPEVLDLLYKGSSWKNPEYWMMGLYKEERVLIAEWKTTEKNKLKNMLKSVSISARATHSDRGYIFLQYTFDNYETCKKEIESVKQDSL